MERHLTPSMVYADSSADVIGTVCAGQWLYRDGALVLQSEIAIAGEARQARTSLLQGLQ